MENLLFGAVMLVATLSPPAQAADVGVSLSIGQPGFYGRLDMGDYPPPQLLYRQPRMIERSDIHRAPVYLRVPPGHARNWRRHCRDYNACDEQVYFVQENWYQREYVPRYQAEHRDRKRNDKHDRHDSNKHHRHENHQ
ncbi:MAG: hypothetical protein WC736_13270 [Gallionella sp.]|jgi:hypothetical protein